MHEGLAAACPGGYTYYYNDRSERALSVAPRGKLYAVPTALMRASPWATKFESRRRNSLYFACMFMLPVAVHKGPSVPACVVSCRVQ